MKPVLQFNRIKKTKNMLALFWNKCAVTTGSDVVIYLFNLSRLRVFIRKEIKKCDFAVKVSFNITINTNIKVM